MTSILWLLLFGVAVGFAWLIRLNVRKYQERQRAEDERFANFMSATAGTQAPPAAPAAAAPAATPVPSPAVAPGNDLALQKMLFDAAHKAAQAGEPALSIQLYARLLSRYPGTALAEPARAAVETLKKKLAKT